MKINLLQIVDGLAIGSKDILEPINGVLEELMEQYEGDSECDLSWILAKAALSGVVYAALSDLELTITG